MAGKYNSPAKQILNGHNKEICLSRSINSNSKQKGNPIDGHHKSKLKEQKITKSPQKNNFEEMLMALQLSKLSSSSEIENHNFLLTDSPSNITDIADFQIKIKENLNLIQI